MPRLPDWTSVGTASPSTAAAAPAVDQSGVIQDKAIENFGATVSDAAEKDFQETQNLARAKAANALLDHQINVETATQDLQRKVQTGEVPYDQAKQQWEDTVGKMQPAAIPNLDPIAAQNYDKGAKRVLLQQGLKMNDVVYAAQRDDFKDQFGTALDNLGKLAGMPDANIDEINQKADGFRGLARKAGIPEAVIDKQIQDFKDRNWFNNAVQVAMESKNSRPDLNQLEHDLTDADGFYAGKLDTEKRNAVLRTVTNDQLILDNKEERLREKREAAGQRALLQMAQQTASGIPATAAQWSVWQQTVKGTESEPEYQAYVNEEAEVQKTLRLPVDQQLKFVQDKETQIRTQGGSLQEAANINRLRNAVEQNVKLLQNDPLTFNATRTGTDVPPLDLTKLGDPNATGQINQELQDRLTTLSAMRKQYGSQIPNKPLLPQEVAQLTSALNSADPKNAAAIFGALQNATGNDMDAYKGIMQQIAPDMPVKALAGILAGKQRQLTTATHWFRPDDVLSSTDVAATMMQGEALQDPTKQQKTADGKPTKSLYLPEEAVTQLQSEFQDRVGAAFAGRPDATQVAFQAVKAYYVGKAAKTGRLAATKQDVDSDLLKEAITATLGNVVDYNGNGSVLAPWGMTVGDFQDRVGPALTLAGKKAGFNDAEQEKLKGAGLRNFGDGTYYAMQGNNFVVDKRGNPITVAIQ